MVDEEVPNISWDKVKEQKISISVGAIVLGLGTFFSLQGWVEAWHETNFVTVARAAETAREVNHNIEDLRQQVQQNTQTLENHVDEFRLYAAITMVSNAEQKLDRHERAEIVSGETPQTRMEENAIRAELQKALDYKECIMEKRPNCHLLVNHQ